MGLKDVGYETMNWIKLVQDCTLLCTWYWMLKYDEF
jgi:hypothetical protein